MFLSTKCFERLPKVEQNSSQMEILGLLSFSRSILRHFDIVKHHLSLLKSLWTTHFSFVSVFNLIRKIYQKFNNVCRKVSKIRKIWNFLVHFRVILRHSGVFEVNQKKSKNQYKNTLLETEIMSSILWVKDIQFAYKFETWHFFGKKTRG